jgi:hypothetical protein
MSWCIVDVDCNPPINMDDGIRVDHDINNNRIFDGVDLNVVVRVMLFVNTSGDTCMVGCISQTHEASYYDKRCSEAHLSQAQR